MNCLIINLHMKKIISILLILIICVSNIFSQKDILFRDDFDNNKNSWRTLNDKEAAAKINGGYYHLAHKRSSVSWRFWRAINIDTRKDFVIEARMKQTRGVDNYGYGIVWGASGWANSFNFTISSNGMFTVGGYDNKKYLTIKKWTSSSKINKMGLHNNLSIHKRGIMLHFYINGSQVYSMIFRKFHGVNTGFILGRDMNVSVDYVVIKQDKAKIDIVKNSGTGADKKNMGIEINSPYSEIAPIISPDGKTLYVARQNHPSNYGSKKLYDIWYSTKNEDGTWTKLKNIGKPLNNDGDNLVISITPDGNTLLLEGLYNSSGGYISDDGISISHKTFRGWSIPKQVRIRNYYNRDEYESFCPSADRKVLIMSVHRDDTHGLKDLYVSFRQSDGTYSKPKNMGARINTQYNDGTPFLAADNKTLYFYSYGHPGYGSADIFVSKRLDNSWTNWSKPKNIGPKINSSEWDTYYSVSAKGDYAYLVSSKNSYGNEDVFHIKLKEEEKPDPVVLIYGKVLDKKTGKPIGANISYENLMTKKEAGIASSNPRTGEYKIVLPYGYQYGFRAIAKKYLSVNENINLIKFKKYIEIKQNLYLAPLEVGTVIKLKNVFFIQASSVLIKTSYPELDRLFDIMKRNPTLIIELGGHTETGGRQENLIRLSNDRVNAVKRYLVNKGIDSERIIGKGYGGTKPLVVSGNQSINRRVEFKILKK